MLLRPLIAVLIAGATAGQAQMKAEEPYLPATAIPDGLVVLPPPPAKGSPAAARDAAVFAATRRLEGTPRWRIATEDVENDPLDRYACALNMQLDARTAPALAHLLDRVGTGDMVGKVKDHYAARRPYLGTDAPICQEKTQHLAENGDYPSGHAANGWLEGLVLAELVPERASMILARARAYGESRAVCGAHSASAVEAGWMAGSTMFAVLHASKGFARDRKAAATELASIGNSAKRPDPQRCAAEAAALAKAPY